MPVASVYWIRCTDHTDMTSQGYIGVSTRFNKRMSEHFKLNQNRHLDFATKKYGWENLIKTQILIAEEDYCLDIERKLRPTDGIGWNCVAGGGKPPINRWNLGTKGVMKAWNKGLKFSDETREKIRQAAKEQWQKPGMRELISNAKKGKPSPRKGKKHTPEAIEKMRLSHTGKPSPKKGIPLTSDQFKKMIESVSEPWTCPHCNRSGINKGAKNRWHFDNCKEKS